MLLELLVVGPTKTIGQVCRWGTFHVEEQQLAKESLQLERNNHWRWNSLIEALGVLMSFHLVLDFFLQAVSYSSVSQMQCEIQRIKMVHSFAFSPAAGWFSFARWFSAATPIDPRPGERAAIWTRSWRREFAGENWDNKWRLDWRFRRFRWSGAAPTEECARSFSRRRKIECHPFCRIQSHPHRRTRRTASQSQHFNVVAFLKFERANFRLTTAEPRHFFNYEKKSEKLYEFFIFVVFPIFNIMRTRKCANEELLFFI